MNLEPGRRFDLIYDGMSGEYAIAGKIIAKSAPHDGLGFHEIDTSSGFWDRDLIASVQLEFLDAKNFRLYLFSHIH